MNAFNMSTSNNSHIVQGGAMVVTRTLPQHYGASKCGARSSYIISVWCFVCVSRNEYWIH